MPEILPHLPAHRGIHINWDQKDTVKNPYSESIAGEDTGDGSCDPYGFIKALCRYV